jgi:hypothetical protein
MAFLMISKPLNVLHQYTHGADHRHNGSTTNTRASGFFLQSVQSSSMSRY